MASDDEAFEFDCPECGQHIKGVVSKCPKCGVEFVIEEAEEIECPNCNTIIPSSSTSCPKCGVEFEFEEVVVAEEVKETPPAVQAAAPIAEPRPDDTELRKQFPELVAEVKPLLALAKEYDIDTSEGRRLIDKAVRAGKGNDVAAAVSYVKECRKSIRGAIDGRLDTDTQHLEELVQVAKSMNSNPSGINEAIKAVKDRRAAGDLQGALEEALKGKKQAEKLTGKYIEAHELTDELDGLIVSCERFYLDVREAKKLLAEAKDAGEHGDWSMMGILARKGREEIMKGLPELMNSELKKAKSLLLDAKAEGKDVSTLVKLLKEAGAA
ncbi:MAG: zinc ribbon domain-containing protein, partial [Methanomassiliicoccales archaeon]|nr:zinc ribbon domain-containing protein [Methanomassiliicoccales archaeon]